MNNKNTPKADSQVMSQDTNTNPQNKLGVVYTPIEVALPVAKLAISKCTKKSLNILEPSVGDGLFLKAILQTGHKITSVDIDKEVLKQLSESTNELPQNDYFFIESDFIEYSLKRTPLSFDLIIGNPPFIKKHDYSENFKSSIESLSSAAEYPKKHLKNAWAAFVVASERLLSKNGVLSFIVPYELMTVSYGQTLQQLIFTRFERVDIYIPDEKAFKDIDQDAVAFVAQKKTKTQKGIYIHRVSSLSELNIISTSNIDYQNTSNVSLDLKGFLFDDKTKSLLKRLRSKCKVVSDYCDSAPGIVTGANDYFIQPKNSIEEHGLMKYSKRILKKASFLPKGPVFTNEFFSEIEKKDSCYFIQLRGEDAASFSDSVNSYLDKGVSLGLPKRYKCSKRKYWYQVPVMPSTEGFFFKRSHNHPRLCINEADVLVTDTAYRIRLKENVTMKGLCYSFYNSLTLLFAEIDGRFYGGGVLELTPSEFKGLPLVYVSPSIVDFDGFTQSHDGSSDVSITEFGDKWLRGKLKLTKDEMSIIHSALKLVKEHRLRHG